MVRGCKDLSYTERLKLLNLPTLKFRRLRGDMIEAFKILNGFYDAQIVPNLIKNQDTRTRGNVLKLSHVRFKYDLRKYSFCVRVINAWNSLPDNVVCATSLNSFKNNLDKYWCKEDMYFNWESDMSCHIIQ